MGSTFGLNIANDRGKTPLAGRLGESGLQPFELGSQQALNFRTADLRRVLKKKHGLFFF